MEMQDHALALWEDAPDEASIRRAPEAGEAAERLSANCFFNALLRETDAGQWIVRDTSLLPSGVRKPAVHIALPASDISLWLNATYRSDCGRHQFALPIRCQDAGGHSREINLAEAVHAVAEEPGIFPQADAGQRRRFLERTRMSIRNMAQALRARENEYPRLFGEPLDFAEAEQALLSGHAVHPTPKSREPLTDADAEIYAPEFGNHFRLQWLAVSPGRLRGANGCAECAEAFARTLWRCDGATAGLPDGYLPVPAHPWQWRHLKPNPRIAGLLADGDILELGEGGSPWRATSSLRAVHGAHSPYMLKFSLSLRLTNSLRTLLPKEMTRGLEIPRIRSTPIGREFAERCPHFRILGEPAYLLLTDSRGESLPESLVLFRDNPFRGEAAGNVCLLATLTQDHPHGEPARAAQLIERYARRHGLTSEAAGKAWFERFLDVVVEPLLIAQADYGLLFGAHQQNLILAFENELPQAGYFRDCQGSGYSRLGASLLQPYLPDLGAGTENVIDDVMANRLFAYYLIVNSCFGLIGAVAAAGLLPERTLLGRLRNRLERLNAGSRRDRSCLEYLLEADELWAKGNFHCAMIGLNETASEDPLAIYHRLPNPLLTRTRP